MEFKIFISTGRVFVKMNDTSIFSGTLMATINVNKLFLSIMFEMFCVLKRFDCNL